MRKKLLVIGLICLLLGLATVVCADPLWENLNKSYCVVASQDGTGSGLLIILGGQTYVLTAYHVVAEGWRRGPLARFDLIFFNKEISKARIFRVDPEYDVALLIADSLPAATVGIAFNDFGDSDQVGFGDQMFKIGTPQGIFDIIGEGRASNRDDFTQSYNFPPVQALIVSFFGQGPGDSGCGIFTKEGKFVGTLVRSHRIGTMFPIDIPTGISLSIPVNTIKIRIPWILAKRYQNGVLRLDAEEQDNGLLLKANVVDTDLRVGDVIFGIEGMKISQLVLFNDVVSSFDSGDDLHLRVYRPLGKEVVEADIVVKVSR